MKLSDPVQFLKGVGPAMAEKLTRLHIHTIQDVIFHLPLRYQDRTRITPIGAVVHASEALIEGEVEHTEIVFGRRRTLLVQVSDGTGSVLLRFFHFNQTQKEALARGVKIRCFGEIRETKFGHAEMVHPEYRTDNQIESHTDQALTPIYPATEGVQQATLRKIARQVLEELDAGLLPDLLPTQHLPECLKHVPTLAEAIRMVHLPGPDIDINALLQGSHPAQQRLAFEELIAHHLSLHTMRKEVQREPAASISSDGKLEQPFRNQLAFQLTNAQERVVNEIKADIKNPWPSLRLVQGDVGSGKTVVAAIAALNAITCGYQATLMAPTELLAEQHFSNLSAWFNPLGIHVGWLSSRVKGKARHETLEKLAQGQYQLMVGTHALFQEDVEFKQLALLIVDEQHRFGVHQRLTLREKGKKHGISPHQIIMTATPIPRTLAMTAYADLDYSVIDELPPGRIPVKTVAFEETKRDQIIQRIRNACLEGKQAYWVCTLIEESEVLQCQAAEDTCGTLAEQMPEIKIGLVHGRMKASDKKDIMTAFKNQEIDLLVATTVIEVGVDVPNASLMIIENAERLGLSQLHQLRGRVGRGAIESACVLLYKSPLGKRSRKRIDTMRRTNDGFEIAEEDLAMRGPGEVLGTKQTGMIDFRVADLVRDEALIEHVHKVAYHLMNKNDKSVPLLIYRWLGSVQKFSMV